MRNRERDEADDVEFSSTSTDVKHFIEHPFWRDMQAYFRDRIEEHLKRLATFDSKNPESLESIRYRQGIISNAEDLLDFPHKALEWLLDEEDNGTDSSDESAR